MIRRSKMSDKSACIRLLRDSHKAAGYTFPFSAVHASVLFDMHHISPNCCIFIMGDEPQGLFMASLFDHPFGAGRYANETVWFVSEGARGRGALKMLDAYEAWAIENGCVAVCMASLSTNDVSKIYARRGYLPAETHFIKNLQPH